MQIFKNHKIIGTLAGILLLFCFVGLSADEDVLAFRAGRIITVTQGTIDNGILLVKGGKIAGIGQNIAIPQGAKVIDAAKYTILPGLIDSFTNLGTTEIESLGSDFDEATSPVTPHLRIVDAINPENSFISIARRSGVTVALTAPGEGNLLSGQSALICLSGDTVEDMVLKVPVAVHGNLGELPKLRYGAKQQMPSTRMGAAALLRQTLIDAREYGNKVLAYEKKLADYRSGKKGDKNEGEEEKGKQDKEKEAAPTPPPRDFKLEPLLPVLKGEMCLIVRANRLDDILTALRIADEFRLKIVLNHGAEAYKIADELAVKNIPVLVGPLADYYQRIETQGALFENVVKLHKAGVKVAFQTGSVQNVSDLLYQAEKAVSYGLPYDEALKALTLYPAQIFGVDDSIGSLENGKAANLVVFEGEPLKRLSRVKMVVIKGKAFEVR
ncbi:MAG: amidohydrolase family protein [Candidatus Aminicenantes bacterium]|nr:amidohydrolase family protein [Candidatus Aminicenantes bacterium]